jgi:hypothetical protein
MTFGFEMSARDSKYGLSADQLKTDALARELKDRQLQLDLESANAKASLGKANQGVESANIELARRKAQQKLDNFNAGVVSSKDKEQEMSDFERKQQSGDYDLGNQIKAWGAANQYRMAEADQSNVAQKDRLGMQLDTQKSMQQSQFGQENKLRTDDNRRAIDGFKLNI